MSDFHDRALGYVDEKPEGEMSEQSKPRASIGDIVYWVEASANYGKKIPCPICFGKRVVTITLGNGEQEPSECGYCSNGFEYATGLAKVWEPHASVKCGEITGISTRDGVKYEIGYQSLRPHEIFADRKDAEALCAERLKEVTKQAEHWFRDSFVTATKKQLWSHGYHKGCIERAERTIEWHKLRLAMSDAKGKSKARGDREGV